MCNREHALFRISHVDRRGDHRRQERPMVRLDVMDVALGLVDPPVTYPALQRPPARRGVGCERMPQCMPRSIGKPSEVTEPIDPLLAVGDRFAVLEAQARLPTLSGPSRTLRA